MGYEFHHVHIKAHEPRKTADWLAQAFEFRIASDTVRARGDRFIMCETADGTRVVVSGARDGEVLGEAGVGAHLGIEHIAITVDDINAEIERLKGLGARLVEGPTDIPKRPTIAFIHTPDDIRIEIVATRPVTPQE